MSSDMKGLVEYIAKSVVSNPESVEVQEKQTRKQLIFKLSVAQEDMGRVIGKQGRMANAMRDLLKVAAVKSGERVALDISE